MKSGDAFLRLTTGGRGASDARKMASRVCLERAGPCLCTGRPMVPRGGIRGEVRDIGLDVVIIGASQKTSCEEVVTVIPCTTVLSTGYGVTTCTLGPGGVNLSPMAGKYEISLYRISGERGGVPIGCPLMGGNWKKVNGFFSIELHHRIKIS